jgi:tetratricopeptide (TPR) repeat protein
MAASFAKSDPYDAQLSSLEATVLKAPANKTGLESRLQALEIAVFGHTHKGSPAQRLIALRHAVGKGASLYLPPLAGHLAPLSKEQELPPPSPPPILPATGPALPFAPQSPSSEVRELLKAAVAAHNAGNNEAAERALTAVLRTNPYNPDALYSLGAIAEERGDLASALADYQTALAASPGDGQLRQAVAQVEADISRRRNAPVYNPLWTAGQNGGVLRGSATAVGAGSQNAQTPLNATAVNGAPLDGNVAQISPEQAPIAASARRSRFAGAGIELGTGLARGALSGGLNGSTLMRSLHCPVCRLLSF